MHKICLILTIFLNFIFVIGQNKSPCPKIVEYDDKNRDSDKWYGTINLFSNTGIKGVFLRIVLDRTAEQLGNWFGEVDTLDNKEFLIQNDNAYLHPNVTQKIRFYIKFSPQDIKPSLLSLELNGKLICHKFYAKLGGAFHKSSLRSALEKEETVLDNVLECGTVVLQPVPLITYGKAARDGEFPWHAALYHARDIDLVYICGASLISTIHVITVAHCVTRRKSRNALTPDNLVVYLGKYYLKKWSGGGIQTRQVREVSIHPNYNSTTYEHDIAVITLSTPAIVTDYVRPICLWEESAEVATITNKLGSVVGWGFDETGHVTKHLTQAKMPVVSRETCVRSFPDFFSRFTTNTTYCAGFTNGTSVCNGDSGGGMAFPISTLENSTRWQLRGLVSISVATEKDFKCDSKHFVVFTDVAKYLSWIKYYLRM